MTDFFFKHKGASPLSGSFYLCLIWLVSSQIAIAILEPRKITFWIIINLALSFLPLILLAYKQFSGERIKLTVLMAVTLSAAYGCYRYLGSSFQGGFYADIRFFICCSTILSVCYLYLLSSCGSNRCRMLVTSLFAVVLFLPLIASFSFDLIKTVNAYHTSILTTGSSKAFFSNKEVMEIPLGLTVRIIIFFTCTFIIQLSLPVLQFRKTDKPTLFLFILPAVLFIVFHTENCYPIAHLNRPTADLFFTNMKKRSNPLKSSSYQVKANSLPGLYFFVIGESHEYRANCDILLKRDSFLRKIHNDKNYIVFKNTKGLTFQHGRGFSGQSEFNVCNMLSLTSQPRSIWSLLLEPDIPDVLQMSNFKTLLIHNQESYELFNKILTAFWARCDHILITDAKSFGGKYQNRGFQVDSELPGLLDKWYKEGVFDKEKSFMFIKPLGLHIDKMIVPSSFKKQHPKLTDEGYGLVYWDDILQKIISKLQSFPETRAVIYCSDHASAKNPENDIVMFVYLSENLQKKRPGLAAKLRKTASKPFSNIDIDKVLLEIMDISVFQTGDSGMKKIRTLD